MLMLSACATDSSIKTSDSFENCTTVRTTGTGANLEEAKQVAFTRAIEYVVGQVIVSNKEVNNNKLTRDEIIKHSAGYVDSYKITEQTTSNNKVTIWADVTVKSSKIQNRILGVPETIKNIDGDKMAAQYKTIIQGKNTGDQVLTTVLKDVGPKSFVVTEDVSTWGVGTDRSALFAIWFKVKWNYNYLTALNEALKITSDKKNSDIPQKRIIVISKNPKSWLLGSKDVYYFNDQSRISLVDAYLTVPVSVEGKMYDANHNLIATQCMFGSAWYPMGGEVHTPESNTVVVYGNDTFEGAMEFKFRPDDPIVSKLQKAKSVELSIVIGNCKVIY